MYSDDWLKAGYYQGDKNILVNDKRINYVFWYDKNNQRVGVTINVLNADDSHYELQYSDFLKLIDTLGGGTDYSKILSEFFKGGRPLYEFSDFMESNDIKFKEIHFY